MAVVEHYNVAHLNSTPDLAEALLKHQQVGGNDWVHAIFAPVFRKHGLDRVLGINLLHHHFHLEAGEYLTDVGGTSTPWKSQTGARPCLWAFDASKLHLKPLEFAMDDDDSRVAYPDWQSDTMTAFLHDLADVINRHCINGIYGLARYPGDDFKGRVEMTVGRANANKHDPAYRSEAAWYFTEDFRKRGCSCNCYYHGTPSSGHAHNPTISE